MDSGFILQDPPPNKASHWIPPLISSNALYSRFEPGVKPQRAIRLSLSSSWLIPHRRAWESKNLNKNPKTP
jgi:hypothetical protein